MEPLSERLRRLGRRIADVDPPDEEAIAHARRRLLRQPAPRRTVRWFVIGVPSIALVAVLAIVIGSPAKGRENESLTYVVNNAPGEQGTWLDAATKPALLQFSDGSRVDVAAAARVRVTAIDARGAAIEVSHGKVMAAVVHSDVSVWRFQTGPYMIRVTGTRFETSWDTNLERFTLDMLEGTVEITGPLLLTPVTVTAGQSVVSYVREDRFEIRRERTTGAALRAAKGAEPAPGDARTAPTSTETTGPRLPAGHANDGSATVAPPVKGTRKPAAPWRDLLAARAYSAAIAAAEQHGFESVLLDATRAELYALSDAARYAERAIRAREALIALRSRFGERGKTAFLLGRIAADRAEADDAIPWFDLYLREEPSGTLVEPALGRLIELTHARDAARARRLAERYLASFPDGTYAALARTMLSK